MNPQPAQPSPSTSTTSSLAWNLPPTLPSRLVYPDNYTTKDELSAAPGKEIDPGRMAIYLCLLDERPHLHPSLAALHKHRHAAHGIPLPPRLDYDLPALEPTTTAGAGRDVDVPELTTKAELGEGMDIDSAVPMIKVQSFSGDIEMERTGQEVTQTQEQEKAEWLIWRFTEEEEARRKAYLPLS